jgi:hypothetical protein
MDISTLTVGQQIGIVYHGSRYNVKAQIGVVASITPTGQVRLNDGRRFTANGCEMGDKFTKGVLCSIEKVNEIVQANEQREEEKKQEKAAFEASPEGKQKLAVDAVITALLATLKAHGYYADVDGHMDAMESTIEQLLREYVATHNPVE